MSNEPARIRHHVQHRHPDDVRFCALCGSEMRLRPVLPDARQHKVCTGCGFVDFQGPKLAAGCAVADGGRVLLLRRGIAPALGKWTFPGGYVDLGETPQAAAAREVSEEVGLAVKLGGLLGLYADAAHPRVVVAVYMAEPGSGMLTTSEEASEVRYFAPAEIPWDEVAFATTKEGLRDWIARVTRS